jgi:L-fuculose-phosphate aldolase
MKKVYSLRDVDELIRQGADLNAILSDSILTPSARDRVREVLDTRRGPAPGTMPASGNPAAGAPAPGSGSPASTAAGAAAAPAGAAGALSSRQPRAELEAYFRSPACEELKQQICAIGRRLWERAYVDGNGGNIAIRVGEDLALCTPTLVSKGFMKPADLCLVDFEGSQLLGSKKRTSEILMHLQMMKSQPRDVASVHCHPPYATAFAVAGVTPPTCMVPEYEVFCAVAVAPYRTPGTPEMGKLVAELVDQHNTILMANHGVVTWSHNNVEEAYWRMEIIEAYCRTLVVAAQLGKPMNTFSPEQLRDLLRIKQSLGFVDPRYGLKECELCDNDEWRPGVTCAMPAREQVVGLDPEAEAVVQAVTDQIMSQMQ